MISIIRTSTILLAIALLTFLGYEAFYHNTARYWVDFQKPQEASYASFEKDGEILNEFRNDGNIDIVNNISPLPELKPSIFETISNH